MVLSSAIPLPKERVELGNRYIGYTLARNVYKDRDMLLLKEGFMLNETYIEKLRNNGIVHVYVYPNKKTGQR